MNVGHRTGLSWSFSFWGKGFGLERQDCGLYLFCAGSLTGLDSSAEHRSPGVERADPQGPSSLPIVRHRWSASTSFVLAALRALHVDPSYAVTKSAMIEEGTSSHWTWHFARTYRTPPSGRGNYGPGSLNRPTFMPGGPTSQLPNFLRMTFGLPTERYDVDPIMAKALDQLLILHADHEQNCSTSTVRLVGSSHANLFASVSVGINALFGPLHGGANQAVLDMLEQIQADGGDVDEFVRKVKNKEGGAKLMGFGHRVYKNYLSLIHISEPT